MRSYITFWIILIPFYLSGQLSGTAELKGDEYSQSCIRFFNVDKDSTIYYAKLSIQEYEKAESWEKYIQMLNALCAAYFSVGDYNEYQSCALRAVQEAEKYLGPSQQLSDALSNYSVFLNEIGAHKSSIEYLKRSLFIENELGSEKGKVITFCNLGGVYLLTGDFDEALRYFYKVESMAEESDDILTLANRVHNNNRIGKVFLKKEELDSALVFFRKSLNLLKGYDVVSEGLFEFEQRIQTNLQIADIFFHKKEKDSVEYYVEQAMRLSKGDYYFFQEKGYEVLGKLYLSEALYEKATSSFLKSQQINAEKFKAFKQHYTFAEKSILLGNTKQLQGDYQSALKEYHNALKMLNDDPISDDLYELPELKNIHSPLVFLDALVGKANVFFECYQKQNSVKKLEAAFEYYKTSVALISDIRQDYNHEKSLLQLSSSVLSIYENGIASAVKLYEIKNDRAYLDQAFIFCERNKSTLLLESIHDNQAKYFAGIPDSLLEQEIRLKNKVLFYQRKLNENRGTGKLQLIQRQLFQLNQDYQTLIKKFEFEYPKYYQIKYSNALATTYDIQEVLKNSKSALVEYFFGERHVYIFCITSNDVVVKAISKNTDLLTAIDVTQNFIKQAPDSNIDQAYKKYSQSAFLVFNQMLKPVLAKETDHLIIIADDALNFLPFECLLTQPADRQHVSFSARRLQYLLEDYAVNYSYSATLFKEHIAQHATNADYRFLGFAPSFDTKSNTEFRVCDERALHNLNCNQEEVIGISKVLKGKILTGKLATKESFNELQSQYQILHLATHACLDEVNPSFNRIYFAEDYLSNIELYNLKVNSDLVVLSACETGSGQLAKGEGVMSLARGFFYAGCPSVVMSLWSVDDCATSEVMMHFYKFLDQGMTKSEALRQAKLLYLSSAKKAQKHPFYWAGFVQIGNHNALSELPKEGSYLNQKYIAFALVCFLCGILFLYRKKLLN